MVGAGKGLDMQKSKMVGFLVVDQALALNLSGPADAFTAANRFLGAAGERYELVFLSRDGGPIRTSSGILVETRALGSVELSDIDTIIVGGGEGVGAMAASDPAVRWLARASALARRTCSICNGAFLLAAAGLLNGRRAVTHWCEVENLRAQYPKVLVELDPIYLRDGKLWTSAGMSAGIDLALALIEEDHGSSVSLAVAKELVVFLRRPGGQAQFSSALTAQTRLGGAPRAKLTELPAWILSNLAADLSIDGLARSIGMTPRTFARNFALTHSGTPAKFVEELRVEAACRYMEDGTADLKRIATLCGFGDEERMRRAFLRRRGVPP
jgi:transcriptional regulator GlxA family with amidase domain